MNAGNVAATNRHPLLDDNDRASGLTWLDMQQHRIMIGPLKEFEDRLFG